MIISYELRKKRKKLKQVKGARKRLLSYLNEQGKSHNIMKKLFYYPYEKIYHLKQVVLEKTIGSLEKEIAVWPR